MHNICLFPHRARRHLSEIRKQFTFVEVLPLAGDEGHPPELLFPQRLATIVPSAPLRFAAYGTHTDSCVQDARYTVVTL